MGDANPTIPGWAVIEEDTSRTLSWSDHGMTIYILAGGDSPVVLTLPLLANFDGFGVRIVQLTESVQLLTSDTGGIYDKILMPNIPSTTEKLEPEGGGVAYSRVEILGRAGEGWLVSGGEGTWVNSDDTSIRFVLGGNAAGTPGNSVAFDAQGQIIDSGSAVPLFFDFRGRYGEATGTATSGGGTTTGDIAVGVSSGIVFGLCVTADSNTVDTDIEFFADVAMTKRVYYAQGKDCWTTPHVDGTAWAAFSFESDLESRSLYYQLTNNGANDSTYKIELFGLGKF